MGSLMDKSIHQLRGEISFLKQAHKAQSLFFSSVFLTVNMGIPALLKIFLRRLFSFPHTFRGCFAVERRRVFPFDVLIHLLFLAQVACAMTSLNENDMPAKALPTITINEDDIPDVIWVEYFDKTKNLPYFYNKETKATTWALPPDYAQWKDAQMKEYLKISTWKQHKRPDDGRIYYSDKITKKTQWNVPDDVKEFERYLSALTVKRRSIKRKVEEPIEKAALTLVKPVETDTTSSSADVLPAKVARISETDGSMTVKGKLTSKESFGALVDADDSDSDREEDYDQDEDTTFGGYKGTTTSHLISSLKLKIIQVLLS